MAIHFERGEELEHVVQFRHVGFAVNGGVGGDLIADNLGHLDGFHAFLEDAFAFDDEIVREFQTVHVDVPVHPFGRTDDGFLFGGGVGGADGLGFLFRDQVGRQQLLELGLDFGGVNGGEVIAHFFAHEHAVRADINHAALLAQTGDEFLDLGIDQGFAAANGNHGGFTFHGGRQALLQRHHVLEGRGIFADAAAAGTREIAGVQRFKLQHHRKLRRTLQFMLNNMTGYLSRQGEGESHSKLTEEINGKSQTNLYIPTAEARPS